MLVLAHNQLKYVPGKVFSHMSSLNSLELDGNKISRLANDAFFGLEGEERTTSTSIFYASHLARRNSFPRSYKPFPFIIEKRYLHFLISAILKISLNFTLRALFSQNRRINLFLLRWKYPQNYCEYVFQSSLASRLFFHIACLWIPFFADLLILIPQAIVVHSPWFGQKGPLTFLITTGMRIEVEWDCGF